jgi:hypothetical protein
MSDLFGILRVRELPKQKINTTMTGIQMLDPGNTDLACLPPAATTWWANKDATPRISIGPIVCPEDYTTATTFTATWDPISTWIACCPS